MKSKKINILILFLFCMSILLSFNIFKVTALSAVRYKFDNSSLVSNTSFPINETFNIRNPIIYTENFNGSYPFTNELGLQSTDINFITLDESSDIGVTTNSTIIENLDNHDKILELKDSSAVQNLKITHNISNIESGTIEFYFRSSFLGGSNFFLNDGITNGILFRLGGGGFLDYRDLGANWINLQILSINFWYHIRIDFETGGGGYLGLAPDRFNIHINSINYNSLEFRNAVDGLDTHIFTIQAGSTGNQYLDGVGYSWLTNYTINQNITPVFSTDTTIQEIDKYEFALSGVNTLHNIGASTYGTWQEADSGGHDTVNIQNDTRNNNNRVIQISTNNEGDTKGIFKDNFSLSSNLVDISFGLEFTDFAGSESYTLINIKTSAITSITGFVMYHNGTFSWLGSIASGGSPLRHDLIANKFYELKILLNFEADSVIIDWYIDGVFDERYVRNLILDSQDGLREIVVSTHWDDSIATTLLYYVGVYDYGQSDSKEIAYFFQVLDIPSWDFRRHNIFRATVTGNLQFGSVEGLNYNVSENIQIITDFNQYNNSDLLVNLIDKFSFIINIPLLIVYIKGSIFEVSNISIDGVILKEKSNIFPLNYTSLNVNISESFFFVDGNRLKFNHISNDTDLEYIQATFDIPHFSTSSKSVSFRSNIDKKASGFLILNFTDGTSNIFELSTLSSTKRIILTQNKTVGQFIIIISDLDDDDITGLTSGFVSDITISIFTNIEIEILTLSLLSVLIPLIMILIPTLSLSEFIGKVAIIPLFLLFSIILTIAGIIPVWLIFIIILSNSVFLLSEKEFLDKKL